MKVKTVGNKMIIAMMALMLLISGTGVSKEIVKADNVDKEWAFSLGVSYTALQHLKGRKKEDYSKTYIFWNSVSGGGLSKITVSPYGANGESGTPKPAGTSSGGEKYYIMNGPGKYSLTNYVKELKMVYARPGMKGNKGSGTASRVWSADSVGSYTVLQ